jgi:hypothetical protein
LICRRLTRIIADIKSFAVASRELGFRSAFHPRESAAILLQFFLRCELPESVL